MTSNVVIIILKSLDGYRVSAVQDVTSEQDYKNGAFIKKHFEHATFRLTQTEAYLDASYFQVKFKAQEGNDLPLACITVDWKNPLPWDRDNVVYPKFGKKLI